MNMQTSRTVKIKKNDLLATIKANKVKHVEDYLQAVIAYKKEALKQLKELTQRVKSDEINDITLKLVTPINNSHIYDEHIKLFEWEIEDEVTLTKEEFDELVLDKSFVSTQAYFLNSTYR